jgi:hypothetical protein
MLSWCPVGTEKFQANIGISGGVQKTIRQSQAVRDQGMEGVKIAEKATLAAQKKNLEGNHLNLKNSSAVLNNNELITRDKKWGLILMMLTWRNLIY